MTSRFEQLPSALRQRGRTTMLGPSGVPALLVTPETGGERSAPPPLVIWMHGRTAFKELDVW